LTLYLAEPVARDSDGAVADPRQLASFVHRGDVLLTSGNTRAAALIKRLTRSTWSHVAMYVGPLDDGPDPLCVVEADIAAGVRPIRLSQINARHVRILRPVHLSDSDRRRVADWVVARIGSEYDLAQAWHLLRNILRFPKAERFRPAPRTSARSVKRFICCSLLADAFAWIGYPIRVGDPPLVPSDFERAPMFETL
jgi:uncharacterized protein (DUF779 family)